MKGLIEKLLAYVRTAILVMAGIYLLLIVVNNWGQSAEIWYWLGKPARNMSILTLAFASFLLGGVVALAGATTLRAVIQYRRSRRERMRQRIDSEIANMNRKASMLRTKPRPVPMPTRTPPSAAAPARVDAEPSPESTIDASAAPPAESDSRAVQL